MFISQLNIFRVNRPDFYEANCHMLPKSATKVRDVYAVHELTQFEFSTRRFYAGLYHHDYGLEDVF